METLSFQINKTDISLENYTMPTPAIPGGCSDIFCTFAFSDDWAGLTKKATFHNISSDYTKNALLSENGCFIPLSVLTYGNIEIGVVGLDGETIVKSVEPLRMPVKRSSYEHAEDMPDIEPALIDQLLAQIAKCNSAIMDVDAKEPVDIYVDNNGYMVLVRADGTEDILTAQGFPPLSENDVNKIMQATIDGWQKQHLQFDASVFDAISNAELEALVDDVF